MLINKVVLINIIIVTIIIIATMIEAGIVYDEKMNAVRITDFPVDMPCTLERLAKMDKTFGWNQITYDKEKSVCTVNCNLIIGTNDGTNTILRIGGKDHPEEILVMKGNVYISPYWIKGENKGNYWKVEKKLNSLVLGDKKDKKIKAVLKLAARKTIYCGRMPDMKKKQWGGGIYIYNSEITAIEQKPGSKIGDPQRGNLYFTGNVELDNATISWVKGAIYGLLQGYRKEYLVKNTAFINVGTALLNGGQFATGCKFENCNTAVKDYGSLNAKLIDCIFKNNKRNWILDHTNNGLTCIDCTWERTELPNTIKSWTYKNKTRYPKFISKRHIIIQVVDANDKPVFGAQVKIKPDKPGSGFPEHKVFKTGKEGKTPGKDNLAKAPLLTEVIKTATDTPDKPEIKEFLYTVTVAKDDKTSSKGGIKAKTSWVTVKLVLK